MLFGHTGAVTCLAVANYTADNTFIVSSADNGYVHCALMSGLFACTRYIMKHHNDIKLITDIEGYYSEFGHLLIIRSSRF